MNKPLSKETRNMILKLGRSGMNAQEITTKLSGEGVRNGAGKPWLSRHVGKVLSTGSRRKKRTVRRAGRVSDDVTTITLLELIYGQVPFNKFVNVAGGLGIQFK